MKTVLLSAFLFVFSSTLFAQDSDEPIPRFHKVPVGNSGTYVYIPNDEEFLAELSYSPDSSKVYNGEVLSGNYRFAVIVVQLNGMELTDKEERESMLSSYMDYLQETFSIVGSAGYGLGHTLEMYPEANGIIDYWEDSDGDQWAVKGWVDAHTMGVLMLYGAEAYPHYTVQDMFLNGFRFDDK